MLRTTNILLFLILVLSVFALINQRVDVFCFLGKCAAVVH